MLLPDHLQKGLDPRSELPDRTRRIDVLQMKKRNMNGLIVGFSCGDLEAKGIAIFVDIENGTVHVEFLGIGPDITESGCDISFKGARLVFPVGLGTIDFIEIPTGQCPMGSKSTSVRGK